VQIGVVFVCEKPDPEYSDANPEVGKALEGGKGLGRGLPCRLEFRPKEKNTGENPSINMSG